MVTMCHQGLLQCTQVPCHPHHKSQAWLPSCPSEDPASPITLAPPHTLAREATLPTISAPAHRGEIEQDQSQADLIQLMWEDCCQYKKGVKGLKSLKNQKVRKIIFIRIILILQPLAHIKLSIRFNRLFNYTLATSYNPHILRDCTKLLNYNNTHPCKVF